MATAPPTIQPQPGRAAALGVYLQPDPRSPTRVGTLLRDGGGTVVFIVDQSYLDLGPDRPVLSARWHQPGDDARTIARLLARNDKIAHMGLLPAWFAGLLPEGALRELVERQLGAGRHDDFDVIAHLGHDLPGAVVVRPEGGADSKPRDNGRDAPAAESGPDAGSPRIRFSLAGIQLKFSMRIAADRLTVPARDEVGDIVAKLPSDRFPGLPEAEFSAMMLAEAAGVRIADVRLVPIEKAEGLPDTWLAHGKTLLAVGRFDRDGDHRVHVEDFAQIIGAVGDRKYTMSNEETNMRIVRRCCRDATGNVLEAVRRIVVNILVGNHDAHLKNWSFLYSGPTQPVLTPAYDIVPVVAFIPDGTLALEFQGTRNPAAIDYRQFERPAKYLDMDPRALIREARQTVARAADVWPALLRDLPLPDAAAAILRRRWETLALARDARNGFARLD